MTQPKNNIILPHTKDYKRKKRILWIVVFSFMLVIIAIWGYSLKNKINDIKQKSQKSNGILQDTKNIWNEVFKSDSSTPTIITTSTWDKIVSTTQMLSTTTPTSSTITTTTINSSTINIIKNKIEEKYK